MGYEICFKYFNKKSEGFGYDTEGDPEVMKVVVGKQWDEVDLNEVAKAVFGQMAKRNILIVDAEIYEFAKKKVSFKLKDDGISIKNRKFSYDITGTIKSESEADPVVEQTVITKSVIPVTELQNFKSSDIKPLRFEIYDPHPDVFQIAKKKNIPFTVGKKYPIYEENIDKRGVMYGMIYITEDDNGYRRALNDKHFVPVQNLTNDFEPNTSPNHVAKAVADVGGAAHDIYTLGRRK